MASIFETRAFFNILLFFVEEAHTVRIRFDNFQVKIKINFPVYCRLKVTEPVKKWIFRRNHYVSRKSSV
jgi:hypothetical protein